MALTRPKYSNIVDGDYKNSCRVATTTNINLISAPLTYDGVTFSKGDRILVTAQNTGSQNGIYVVLDEGTGSNGTWVRSFDANDGTRLSGGSQTSTGEGSYAGAIWRLTTPDPIVIGTTALIWATGSVFAGGANKQVQYNDNGILAGTAWLLIDEATGNVIVQSTNDSSNVSTGSATILGGAGIAKTLNVGSAINVPSGPIHGQSINTANLRVTGGSITGTTGAFTTLQADNFSSANIYQSVVGTLVATNFSSGNIYQSTADTLVATNLSAANIYQTTGQSLQSPNVQIGEDWGSLSRANLVVGNIKSLHATEGNITTLVATNFSSANIYQSGTAQSIQTANAQIGENWGDTSRANLAVANIRVLNTTTGNVTTLVATNFSSANIYQSAADTLVATNFSTTNARVTSGSITGTTGAFTTLQADNFSSANIYQSAAGTLVVTNLSSGNIYQSAADTLVATNFSSGNIRTTGGSVTGATGAFTTLVATSFSSGNIYQSAADTFVATNLSSGNIYQSAAGTLVATNFSSGNARITGGFADNFPIGANTRAPGSFTTMQAFSDSAVYANLTVSGNLTIFGNITTVGTTDLSVTDSIINLHTAANLTAWTVNDGRDIGIKMHYYDTEDSHAFIGRENSTGFLEWIARGTESTGNVFTGTLGTIRTGEYVAANNTPSTSTTTGAIRVTGGIGIGNGLYVNGTSWFQNASTANAIVTGGSVTGTTGAFTTLQADNFSSPNVRAVGGSITGATGAFTTLQASNFSSANIYQSAAGTLVATNFSSGNIYQSAAGTLVATNFSSGNAQVTGGSVTGVTAAATTLVATNFSSGNIYQSAAGTLVATNFSTANAQVTGGSVTGVTGAATTLVATNFSSGNIYQSAADTLVTNNFSASNVWIHGGNITVSGVVKPNANATINLGEPTAYWNNLYAKTISANIVAVGNDIEVQGNVKFNGNLYQDGDLKLLLDYDVSATPPLNPTFGDRWYDTTTDTIYEYTSDGNYEFWLDTTGIAVPVTYTASSTAPSAPKAGDYWYDTSSDVLYTRVDNQTTSFWVDFSGQGAVNDITGPDSTIQVNFGGTGKTYFTPNIILKGDGVGPLLEAIPGTDYIAPSANSVITNFEFAGEIARFGTYANISTLYTSSIINTGTYTGTGMTVEALTVNGNILVGNLNTATDIRTEGHLIAGNVYANNVISGINLTYSGNIQYDNLVVGNVYSSNVILGYIPGTTYVDTTSSAASYPDAATVDFPNFSGMILVTAFTSGNTILYLCGGNSATPIGASVFGGIFGVIAYNAAIAGYTWTNNTGSTLEASFAAIKTRNAP